MEYECLKALESNENLKKVKYLLIQFHNFNSNSDRDYRSVIETVEKSHESVFKYKWLWELYRIKPIQIYINLNIKKIYTHYTLGYHLCLNKKSKMDKIIKQKRNDCTFLNKSIIYV